MDAHRHLRGSGEKLDIIATNQPSSEDIEGEFFEQKRARIVSEDDAEEGKTVSKLGNPHNFPPN